MKCKHRFVEILGGLCLLLTPALRGTTLTETFASDPTQTGWRTTGDSNLFDWQADTEDLAVTWDSARSNSFFYLPLNTILSRSDSFTLGFTIRLDDIAAGTTTGKPYTFEIAIGLLNLSKATRTGFLRGTGSDSTDLVEWDYFPDSGFGATVAGAMISDSNHWATSFNDPLELVAGSSYQFTMDYRAETQTMTIQMLTGGSSTNLQAIVLTSAFDDFHVDTFAISSYSDAGQDPQYAGSVVAHGEVDDISLVLPPPPVQDFSGALIQNHWQASFVGQTNWLYDLESSADLRTWTRVTSPVPGVGLSQTLTDPSPVLPMGFYRLKAIKP